MWRQKPKRTYVTRDPAVTSAMMSAVKNRDSKAELLLRRALFARGWRYRLHSRKLIGQPDLVFGTRKIVVFVDGDFWHGRALLEEGVEGLRKGLRTERSDWWIKKIKKTIQRDSDVNASLKSNGWIVLRFWESNILADVNTVVKAIESTLSLCERAQ